jgi:hypothetical protein
MFWYQFLKLMLFLKDIYIERMEIIKIKAPQHNQISEVSKYREDSRTKIGLQLQLNILTFSSSKSLVTVPIFWLLMN